MIVFVANSRKATVISDEPITAGSIGIPISFVLSEHFDSLENIAVFQGCGKTVILVLTSQDTYVPPEVVATDGGSLRIGVYGRNADGTIAVPTVWGSPFTIVPGSIPSGLNPEQPTPDWTAQIHALAMDALQTAREALSKSTHDNSIQIGETVITEEQLKALLALLN